MQGTEESIAVRTNPVLRWEYQSPVTARNSSLWIDLIITGLPGDAATDVTGPGTMLVIALLEVLKLRGRQAVILNQQANQRAVLTALLLVAVLLPTVPLTFQCTSASNDTGAC